MRIIARHNVNFGALEIASALRAARAGSDAVRGFERAFAAFHGARYALATGSGRAALYLALRGLELPPGTPVALPDYCFYTLPAVVEALKLRPVYVPCDPRTYAIDPERLEPALPPGTGALVVLHPFGQAAPMDGIREVCGRRGVEVLEDPSQSIGGRYRGRALGTLGRAAAFSLVSGKNLTACGGGMLLTDDGGLAKGARAALEGAPEIVDPWLEVAATTGRWALSTRPGFAAVLFPPFYVLNAVDRARLDALFEEAPVPFDPARSLSRLSAMQAGVGVAQLKRLEALNARRRENAALLLARLEGTPGLELPVVVDGCEPTFNAVAVRVRDARRFRQALLRRGVDSREDYMRWYGGEAPRGGAPRRDEVLYLPNHPALSRAAVEYVARVAGEVAGESG